MHLTIQTGSDNPILRATAREVKPSELHSLRPLAEAMVAYLKNPKHRGIGLAAPQVGVSKRVIVVGLPKDRDDEKYPIVLMINPVIVSTAPQDNIDEEGCLSLPNIVGSVRRSISLEVTWIDLKGIKMQKKITGFGARVIQHEIDHLNGVMIIDKFIKDLK